MTNSGEDLGEEFGGDRRRIPARMRPKRRKKPPPKPAVTERVVDQRKQPLSECARCGTPLPTAASTGRPRVYCTQACRKAAYEDRRAHRDGAVQVQLVDRSVTQTIEKTIRRPHSRRECVETVMDNPHAIREVLIETSRLLGSKRITPADAVFWDLATSTEFLSEAINRAVVRETGGQDGRRDGRRPS